jgi:hypothetical protein
MSHDPEDIDLFLLIADMCNQPIFISTDVKNDHGVTFGGANHVGSGEQTSHLSK